MTSRERVLLALRRRETDRIPYNIRMSPDLTRRVRDHLGEVDLETRLGYDIRFVQYRSDPANADFSRYFAGIPEGAAIDPWGVASVKGNFYHFARSLPPMRGLKLDDLESYPWPDFEPSLEEMQKQVTEIQASGFAAVSNYECGAYEQACSLRGQERFLEDMAGDPGFAKALLDRIAEIKALKAMAYTRAGVDVLWIGDDLGTQRGLVFGPDTWRRMVRPALRRIAQAVRSIRPDVLIAYHSCGHVAPLVGELADAGIDVLEAVQPEANDVEELKAVHGHRLSFWGTMGAQSTFSRGTTADVRREVRARIWNVGKGGGLMLAPAHVLEPEVPVENVLAFVDEIMRRR